MNTKRKTLPPYARQLIQRMKAGYRPTNGVNVYASWDFGRHLLDIGMKDLIVFPPDADPQSYDWSFFSGQDVSLINSGGHADYDVLKDLAALLVRSGARRVGLIDPLHPLLWFEPARKAA